MIQDHKLERLERLSKLRDSGALTQAEFDAEKSAVLNGDATGDGEEPKRVIRSWLLGGILVVVFAAAVAWSQFGDIPRNNAKPPEELKAEPLTEPVPLPSPSVSAPADPLAIVSRQWLIGGWIPVEQDCASDGGVLYHSDGTYWALNQAGTWTLEGRTIVTFLTEEKDENGEWRDLDRPVRSTERFVSAKANEYKTIDPDGEQFHNRRCKEANVH